MYHTTNGPPARPAGGYARGTAQFGGGHGTRPMTDLLDPFSKKGSVLGRLPDAEETIRQILRHADETLRLHLVHDGVLGRSNRSVGGARPDGRCCPRTCCGATTQWRQRIVRCCLAAPGCGVLSPDGGPRRPTPLISTPPGCRRSALEDVRSFGQSITQ